MSGKVKAKKWLGQHFLRNDEISRKIADAVEPGLWEVLYEIGPGDGALTNHLLSKNLPEFKVIDIDTESIRYLHQRFPGLKGNILEEDFLKYRFPSEYNKIGVIGNFPYNISSQILFKVLEERERVTEVAGMFQKEVAERVASKPGSKVYGILSVLCQAFYDVSYLFSVSPDNFEPPPKVESGVIRLQRKAPFHLDCDERFFFTVVKTAFNQRRKTLRNSLSPLISDPLVKDREIFTKRPEQLPFEDFVFLAKLLKAS